MAIEHLRNRKLLPCIKYFRRVIEFNENKFVLKIPVGYGNYFGVDNWLSNETVSFTIFMIYMFFDFN